MNDEGPAGVTSSSSAKSQSRTEFEFIESLRQKVASGEASSAELSLGIGDDAAAVQPKAGQEIVVSTDLLVEDIDFRRTNTAPFLLGYKALTVSMSDIAAMGARPRWCLLSIGLPDDVWNSNFIDKFYDGLLELAHRYDVQLIGGDTSRTPERIVINSTVIGECDAGRVVKRSGAKPGDQIFLTGELGGAASGLRLLERGAHLPENGAAADFQSLDHLLIRHLRPEPRVGWGLVLGQERLASAMIDLSDGLSSDLKHLCTESAVGAQIDSALIPIDKHVVELCGRRALDPLQLALHGGEDFELLFTVRPELVGRLPRRVDGVPVTRVGEITFEGDVTIAEGSRVWPLKPGGWQHF